MGLYNRLKNQLAILLLTSVFTCCVAPRCFSCTQNDEGCGDHFGLPATAAIFCDGTCVKMRGERYSDSVRIVEVTRMCIAQRKEGCYDTTWNAISVEACACNSDYCNTGTTALPLTSAYIIQMFLGVSVWWMQFERCVLI